jgi:cobalt-zinc-cadmium efflux system membrane fusion protein
MNQINLYITIFRATLFLLFAAMIAGCGNTPPEDAGKPTVVETARCGPHQLPVSDCFMCDPALRDPNRLWCREHDRYEDRCFICHPELKEANRLWCKAHNLYEDECIFCHPELKETAQSTAPHHSPAGHDDDTGSHADGGLYCNEHNVHENECGICHPELAGELKVGQGLKIRFESPESANKAGVRITRPAEGEALTGFSFLGKVTYNQNRYARVTPLASGVVQRVLADVGDYVRKGQPLVDIAAPEIAAAKNDYLTALADEALKATIFKRNKGLIDEKIAAQQDFELAEFEYELAKTKTETARQQLLNFGFSDAQLPAIVKERSGASTLPVLAPFSGTLINRTAVIGEVVNPGDMLFTVAELSTMWLELSIPEDRIAYISLGDAVEATFEALDVCLTGKISWLAAGLDEHTRMLKARAVVPNPDARLKDGFYGQVRIVSQRRLSGLLVPSESLHRFEKKPFVFTRLADDLYEVRRVEVTGQNGRLVEILAGLSLDDQVVSAHSFTVKSEFLKARLGAGCVDD